ncbi:hypothetical protein N7516_006463 [Penicillium verrucosum]|uniref:uncharacterized protein n=1 Tax=Penicillium verrucosum TaxID=60171 RepID=UPI00254543C3|nr:uncharacterized protein N7516_006463 [Penicillium verrucosum]KAJ5931974.1 hypothetical protein N7516_006463 [Penicillium verrucosum]
MQKALDSVNRAYIQLKCKTWYTRALSRSGLYNDETISYFCSSYGNGIKANVFTTFGIGALVGVVTAYATQLFDTIKTPAQGVEGAGIGEACQSVIREYGIRGSASSEWRYLIFCYEEVAAILSPGTNR